uniref:Ankyrin repeat protein n=1 Tax=viral metagenome TaxID=1070528 RepID=A0A6C0JUS8_9ZZZZ
MDPLELVELEKGIKMAAETDNLTVTKLLFPLCCDNSIIIDEAFLRACTRNSIRVVEYFINQGVIPSQRHFEDACCYSHNIELVKLLINHPAIDPSYTRIFVQSKIRNYAVRSAYLGGNIEILVFLLADPRVQKESLQDIELQGHQQWAHITPIMKEAIDNQKFGLDGDVYHQGLDVIENIQN